MEIFELTRRYYGNSAKLKRQSDVGGIVIKHWMAAGCVALMVAAAPPVVAAAPAQSFERLSFGKGRPVPAGDVVAGENIFNAVCWACHSRDLTGGRAPPLTGSAFYKEWRGRDAVELAAFIRNRMPTDDPGALSERGARNVVAYIVAFANKPKRLKETGK